MTDLVIWTDPPDKFGQTFGTAGQIQMFIVGPDEESGRFVLMTRDLFGMSAGQFAVRPAMFDTQDEAHRAAEVEIVRILDQLDTTAQALRTPAR